MTLKVDMIEKADGSPVDLTGQAAAKAYGWFPDDTGLTTSFNISSFTDNGVGSYRLTLTNVMLNAMQPWNMMAQVNDRHVFGTNQVFSSNDFQARNDTGTAYDTGGSLIVHGDLS